MTGSRHRLLSWDLLLVLVFAFGAARTLIYPILEPGLLGSHAFFYTEATRAWLEGGNPWSVGPPAVVFAGPPTMLLTFLPFVVMPELVLRSVAIVGTALLAWWAIRRLGLPLYWLAYPPILGAIIVGHPEVLVLFLLVAGGAASGLAALIKPYAGFALLAERRWTAFAVAIAVFLITLPILPWQRFLAELPAITANLVRQNDGDSVFGDPVLMAAALVALVIIGPRRGLWLATPVLWPYAQPGYRIMCLPAMSPILAVFWALPFPGATLAGLVVEASLIAASRFVQLPGWLRAGLLEPPDRMRDPWISRDRASGAMARTWWSRLGTRDRQR